MSDINASPKYIKPITEAEYKQQSTEYTTKALKELQEQMKHQPIRKRSIKDLESSSGSDDDANLEDNLEDKPEIIIKHVINSGKSISKLKSKSKLTTADNVDNADNKHLDILESLQIKYDLVMVKNSKLHDKIKILVDEIDDLGRRNHFLKLDLGNAKCSIDEQKYRINLLESETLEYKKEIARLNREKTYLDRFIKGLYCLITLFIIMIMIIIILMFI